MKTLVLSLGGSLIIPDKIDFKFLHKFKEVIRKHYKTHRFAIVCGGGSIARKYIESLREEHKTKFALSQAGIRATRMNALFMMQFFGSDANKILPKDMEEVKAQLKKHKVVFCGALRYVDNETSDGNAAKLANILKTDFINLTNVSGLYTKDPNKYKDFKFISSIGWKEFEKMAKSIKFHPGQHFVLDQEASTIIRKHKIQTFILGRDLKNLDNLIKNKPFRGTTIKDD